LGILGVPLPPPPGQVRIRRESKEYAAFAGDQLHLRVGLLGDVGPSSPTFRVRMAYTPDGADIPNPIENLPVTFTRGPDGDYHGVVVFSTAGYAVIEIGTKGETAAGQSFADSAIFVARVNQVVARVLSLDAKGVDLNGDHKFDRLDTTTTLEVIVPGEYTETVYVTDSKQRKVGGLIGIASATLPSGRQTLTNSISGWRIWNQLPDAPYEVHVEQIFLGNGQLVGGVAQWSHVLREPRDAWDHGPTYGRDDAEIHGILLSPSGRFRLAEVEWEVMTPGGHCSWGGTLAAIGAPHLHAARSAEIPPGRHKVSLFFDGAEIAKIGAHQWTLSAEIECTGVIGRGSLVDRIVNLDGDLFQPENPDFLFSGQENFGGDGGEWHARLQVNNYKGKLGPHLQLTEVPRELDAQLIPEFESRTTSAAELRVKVLPGTSKGRYFIQFAATSDSETATRYIPVDISSLDVERVKNEP